MIGKFKFRTLLVLAAAVLLASCSQDEVMTDTGHDGLVPVTLSVAVGDGVQTRTVSADKDEDPTRCYVQVFTTDDNGTTLTPAPGDLASPLDMGEPTAEGTFSLANVYLNPNETYVFLYWADNVEREGEDVSPLTDLTNVPYQKYAIAWAERSEPWTYQGTAEISAQLQHVVAKVTLKTTTNVEASDEITVTMPTTYHAYNVNTEAPITAADNTTFVHTVTSDITGTEDGAEVFSFYALVDEANQDLTLANGTNSQPVSNVPLGPNKHTILVGDVRNLGLTNVTFTANMDTNWGSDETTGFSGYTTDGQGNYTVTNADGLKAIADLVNGGATSINITLANDINLTGIEWTPIGTGTNKYAGTFEGNNKTITGLKITNHEYTGLFGFIGSGGTIKNLTLANVDVSGNENVGAVAGICMGATFIGCSVSGTINGTEYVGAIIGDQTGGSISECSSSAVVNGQDYVGGIAGATQGRTTLIACYATGNVVRTGDGVGGVTGINGTGTLIACYATGSVSGTGNYVGGVAGWNTAGTLKACYHAKGSVSGQAGTTGGVTGRNLSDSYSGDAIVTACYFENEQNTGIGENKGSIAEATKVDGDWTDAVSKMNAVLSDDYGWEWTIEAPNTLPTLKKKETN